MDDQSLNRNNNARNYNVLCALILSLSVLLFTFFIFKNDNSINTTNIILTIILAILTFIIYLFFINLSDKKLSNNIIYNKIKEHVLYILILLLVIIIFYHDYIALYSFPGRYRDFTRNNLPIVNLIQNSISQYGELPLWNPISWQGNPFIAQPVNPMFYPLYFIFLGLPGVGTLLLSMLLHFFIGGLGVYALLNHLGADKRAALLSAVVFLFSSLNSLNFTNGFQQLFYGLMLLPWIVLFFYKAIDLKSFIPYSLIAGLLLGLQFISASIQNFIYTGIIIFILFIYKICYNKFRIELIIKLTIILIISLTFTLGLMTIKLLPSVDFVQITNRNTPFPPVNFPFLVQSFDNFTCFFISGWCGDASGGVGYIASLLVLINIIYFKKQDRSFFFILIILGLLLMLAVPGIYDLYYKVPILNKNRYHERVLVLFSFGATILAGLGWNIIINKLKNKNFSNIKINILSNIIIIFIMLTLYFSYNISQTGDNELIRERYYDNVEKTEILNYIKEQPGLFRYHALESKGPDNTRWGYGSYLNLQELYGADGSIWMPEYMNVFMPLYFASPAKILGILNVKYITASNETPINNLTLIKRFNDCEPCFRNPVENYFFDGPYLYINEKYLPRAYLVDNAILFLGDKSKDLIYYLLIKNEFSPVNNALIQGEEKDYSIDELKKYKAIVLTNNIKTNLATINEYNKQEGIVITFENNKIAESLDKLNKILSSFNEKDYNKVKELNITRYSPNKISIKINNNSAGFLVLSEKFFMFKDDWKSSSEKENKDILMVNGMNSIVYINNDSQIDFNYKPKRFFTGAIITTLTFVILVSLLFYRKIWMITIKE